ncbi:MAG: toll/interleukin-1 receptor domain-containing protein [Firmicutes bacterium]|nr:toll/interleukin-1 receptor domain-containing protein [Bacillota bacterium]
MKFFDSILNVFRKDKSEETKATENEAAGVDFAEEELLLPVRAEDKAKKENATFPPRFNVWYKVRFWLIYLAAPALLLGAALLFLGGMLFDLDFEGIGHGGSLAIQLIFFILCLGGTAYLLLQTFRLGTVRGYFQASTSYAFKRRMNALLSGAQEIFKQKTADRTDAGAATIDMEKETLMQLVSSALRLRDFRKLYKTDSSLIKMEAVALNQAVIMRKALDAPQFVYESFLAEVKKNRFCIEELFVGTTAQAYKGDANFAFISYAHANNKAVLEIIKKLQAARLNIWFDEGIVEGEDWMDHLAKKIDACSVFVMFQTTAYVRSVNCNVEIKRALKTGRKIIRVILENSKLPDGIEMYLDAIQAIDGMGGIETKMDKLVELLQDVRQAEEGLVVTGH